MKLKFVLLMLLMSLLSACSLFGRDRTGYEDSDSVGDLSVPPELNLPKRDSNYDIPEAKETSGSENAELVEDVTEKVKTEIEEVVDKTE